VTEVAHQLAAEVLAAGGTAIDATAGNGQDTARLAQLVGDKGHVLALDIQPLAVATTKARLGAAGLSARCDIRLADHADLGRLAVPLRGKVDCVLLNLGYLPGSDRALITKPPTTGKALQAALGLLRTGGRIVCAVYTGHPGGEAESQAVERFGACCEEAGHEVCRIGREPGTGRPWILSVTRRP
jgi:SAM-dependent methyltransferase